MNKVQKFALVFFTSYLTFLFLNIFYLRSWSLSGDDLYSLTHAIPTFPALFQGIFHSFTGQYRHLTYFLFSIYKLFLPHFFIIFLLHLVILSAIPTLLFFILSDKLKYWQKFLLITPIFTSPIFYYHTFTISSLANVLIAIITLIQIYYFKHRDKYLTWKYSLLFFSLVVLAFTIKETFVLPLTIFCITQLSHVFKGKKNGVVFIGLSVLIFSAYLIKRWTGYQSNIPTDYYFIFTPQQLVSNTANLAAWLLQYPKGWQYGAPLRYAPWQILLSGFYLILISVGVIASFLKNRLITLTYLLFIAVSVFVYIFLNNFHVFYIDLPLLMLIILLSIGTQHIFKWNKKAGFLFITLFFILNVINLILIKPQWVEYSFVANANKAAKNYRQVLEANNYEQYQQICIIDHHRGGFGTEDGNLANHLNKKTFTIVSTNEKEVPQRCQGEDSLVLENDAWSYHLYNQPEESL